MTQYYACKIGSSWKLVNAGNPDEAFRKAFGSGFSPSAHRIKDPYEIVVSLGTRKAEAQSKYAHIEKGTSHISHCVYCGTSYLAEPHRAGFRLCPGDCGRSVCINGDPYE